VTSTRIHHVQVAVPRGGEAEGRRFYGGLLGLSEIPKPENLAKRGGVWFQTGNLQLHLGVDSAFSPSVKAHVAYEVDDLEAVRGRLEAAGVSSLDDEPLPGFDRFYVADPFGNRLEILQLR
jgi:catechol 2,3-dioxygenase-like lactoylglutathione lyase family enzyme